MVDISHIEKLIESHSARVGVIGLGYVGLPVACLMAKAGFVVTGLDIKQDRVDKINQGICPIEGKEPGLSALLTEVINEGKLTASTDYEFG